MSAPPCKSIVFLEGASGLRAALLSLLILSTAGCYDAQHEIFRRKDSVAIPGLEGQYVRQRGQQISRFTVSQEQAGGDYRIAESSRFADGPETGGEVGSLRAVSLGNDLFIAQVHYAGRKLDSDLYALLVFRATRSADSILKFEELIPDRKIAEGLAQRVGIDIWSQKFKQAPGLSGARALIERFLREVAAGPSQTGDSYLRMTEGAQ
jgi:hypothetical protein